MTESEAERAWMRWAKDHWSDLARSNSEAVRLREAFRAGFAAGVKRETAEYHDPDCKGCPDCEGVKGPVT